MTQGRWQDWIGRRQVATDRVSDFPARALAAAFDRPQPLSDGDTLPALWSWLYFLPRRDVERATRIATELRRMEVDAALCVPV